MSIETRKYSPRRRPRQVVALTFASSVLGVAVLLAVGGPVASAATASVNLNSAQTFAVLASSTITNTGSSVISGDIGLSPGTSITGFPPGTDSGTMHTTDAAAAQAQTDLTAAYTDASTRTPTTSEPANLGGLTLGAGVYNVPSAAVIQSSPLTLNGAGDSTSVFIIQLSSTLTTASASSVVLENGAQACNVFWQVGSSATLGTNSTFVGTVMALASITATTGANVSGRLLARTGAVTLDTNNVTVPTCSTPATTTTVATTTTTTVAPTTTTTVAPTTTTTVQTTTTTSPVIPVGAPQTGFGGTAGGSSSTSALIVLSALAAISGSTLVGYELRRRRAMNHSGDVDERR